MKTANAARCPSAPAITKAASKQTYYTIKLFVDSELKADAYRAYAYFRWVDDQIDQGGMTQDHIAAFIKRQKLLVQACIEQNKEISASHEELLLVQLIQNNQFDHSGLITYITHMMQVMEIDAARRGSQISQGELRGYTQALATAVTEALHYFIGHNSYAPSGTGRCHAVTGAHITHMLRDTFEDIQAGYFNIPQEYLKTHQIQPGDVRHAAYRTWVQRQVLLARAYFQSGKAQLARVESIRCALAGYAYIARFEWVLDAIEASSYIIQPSYSRRKSFPAAIKMGWSALSMFFRYYWPGKKLPVGTTILEKEL